MPSFLPAPVLPTPQERLTKFYRQPCKPGEGDRFLAILCAVVVADLRRWLS